MFAKRKNGGGRRQRRQKQAQNRPVESLAPSQGPDDFPLANAACGCRCRIRRHHAQGAVRQRLLDMGFIPDSEVEVVRVATLGDPIEVKVGESWVTLRKSEAEKIEVTDC